MKNYFETISIINKELFFIDEQIKRIISYSPNFLFDNLIDFILAKSKKIRSVITILVLKSILGEVSETQLKICALVELIHNASLIHDDIIDNAEKRRNKPSFNKLFGEKNAVITGDFLLSLSLKELSNINNSKVTSFFANSLTNICLGELNQNFERHQILSIEKYIEKSKLKTAELFKLSLNSCLIAENQQKYLNFAEDFTNNFGIAFQIRDDINDFSKNLSDKTKNDFQNGIYTAPIIYFKEQYQNKEISIENILNSNAITKSELLCNHYVNNALDLLTDFSDNQYKTILTNLCKQLKGPNDEN